MIRTAALLTLPLLTACATMGNTVPDAPARDWTFVTIDGAKPVSDNTSLTIEAERIGASVGCNGIGGGLKIEPGRLKVGMLISTQMYCDGLMEQERVVAKLLGASPSYTITGHRMVLRSATHTAELVKATAP